MPLELRNSRTAPGYKIVAVNCDVIVESGVAGSRSQFCVWSAHWQDGRDKPSKRPYGDDGRTIGTNDPEKWLSFDDARKLYEAGGYDGVGVLLSSLVGFIGIDLDNCLDDSGHALPESKELVEAFLGLGGYMERSPSGKGLRQFIKGRLPSGYKEKAAWGEIYDYRSTRYLTLTGAVWPDWLQQVGLVIENQKGLDAFMSQFGEKRAAPAMARGEGADFPEVKRTAAEVLALLKQHNRQGKVTRLLAGDTSDHDGDHSDADDDLCCQAAYFCRDPEVIDQIMRGSGLMRPKWDDMRGSETYGQRTIRIALNQQSRNYDEDKAEKQKAASAAKKEKAELVKLAADVMVGGIADLMTSRGGIKLNPWVLSELLLRDKRLIGVLHFDEFSGYVICNRPLSEVLNDKSAPARIGRIDDDHIRAFGRWFGRAWGLSLKPEQVGAAVIACAEAVRINPVIQKLEALEQAWDGKPRIDSWLVAYCKAETKRGADNISEYVAAVGARFLISAVARAFKPGCKADCMLVLEGQQGARKSSAVRVLTEAVGPEYFREGFHLGGGKDDQIALRGRWVVEWGEMSGLGKRDRNELKTFLSQQTDSYRQPYGGLEKDWPRTAVFVGTTNDGDYLADPTGGRRFWPVTVGRVDLDRLRRDAPQLWAEAVHRYKAGESWWFNDLDPRDQRLLAMAQREQQKRVGSTFWGEVAAELADKLVTGQLAYVTKAGELATAQPSEKFNRGQMTVWLSQCAIAAGVVAGADGLDDDSGKSVTIDDRNWLKVVDGLKLAGWESSKSNGLIKWCLTLERREALCLQYGLDIGPKIGPLKRAFGEGRGGVATTTAAANDADISQCEMPKNRGEGQG